MFRTLSWIRIISIVILLEKATRAKQKYKIQWIIPKNKILNWKIFLSLKEKPYSTNNLMIINKRLRTNLVSKILGIVNKT